MAMLRSVHAALCGGDSAPARTLPQALTPKGTSRWEAGAGVVAGDPDGAAQHSVCDAIFAEGGNAVDACVATAMVSWLTSPQMCGAGGYGGAAVVALPGREPVAIDYDTLSPADLSQHPVAQAQAAGEGTEMDLQEKSETGWLTSGVPGTLGGMSLLIERFGNLPLSRIVAPAVNLARNGCTVTSGFANSSRNMAEVLAKDPGSAALLLRPDGSPWEAVS